MYKLIIGSLLLSISLFAQDNIAVQPVLQKDQLFNVSDAIPAKKEESKIPTFEIKIHEKDGEYFLWKMEQQIAEQKEKITIEQNYNPCADDGGKIIGNGGKGFVCPNDEGQQVYLLDYIKATHDWNLYIVPADGENEYEKAKELVKRLADFDPIRVEYYLAAIDDFKSNHQFMNYHDFTYIRDYEEYTLPKGCTVEVIVNQKKPRFAEDKRYRINNDLWRKLSSDDRAGLILHEVIYREALQLGQKTATNVVYFNAVIAGKIFYLNEDGYNRVLQSISFPQYK